MSVIRSLTSSRDSEERDREKANLEHDFRQSDVKLNRYVISHHSDLTYVMQAYSKVSANLLLSKTKLKETREKLITCQQLLHCKRDELKKLYLESMENKFVLELLDQVETVCQANNKIKKLIEKKQYLTATKLLVESTNNLATSLKNVEALKEIRNDLDNCQDQIYDSLIDELHRSLYVEPLSVCIENFQRSAAANGAQSRKVSVVDMLSPALNRYQPKRKNFYNLAAALNFDATEDITSLDSIDPIRFIAILVQCLNLLDKTEDAIQIIKDRTETELMNVVKRTGSMMLEKMKEKQPIRPSAKHHLNSWSYKLNLALPCVLRCNAILTNPDHSAYLLNDLCHLLFEQFRTVAQLHEQMLIPMFKRIESLQNSPEKAKSKQQVNFDVYSMTDIWNKIQQVLNIVTDLYLDVNGTSNQGQMSSAGGKLGASELLNALDGALSGFGKNFDLNSFFVKKRVGLSAAVQAGNQLISNKQNFLNNIQSMSYGQSSASKKSSLFRFDCSSHSISLNSYLSEQKSAAAESGKKPNGSMAKGNSFDSDESTVISSIYDDQQIKNQDYILCPPTCENILVLFLPLMKFVNEIDEKLNQDTNTHCVLYSQLKSFANSFIKIQLNSDLDRVLDYSTKCLGNFTVLADTVQLAKLNRDRPLLLSTVIIIQCINDMRQLMHKLPLNCEELLLMINELLAGYRENCLTIYKMIVEKEEEKKIISANWARDEDISRCLKSLPNWVNLSKYYNNTNDQLYLNSSSQSRMSTLSFDKADESPEDVHLRNKRETELLISNITQDSLIPGNEVLNEVEQLKNLAQLQEAMEYLGFECIRLADGLPTRQSMKSELDIVEFSSTYIQDEKQIATFKRLGKEFIEFSECILLVLHLECRVHCFYYLLRLFYQSSFVSNADNQEIDQEVLEFNKDLALIDEQLNIYLQNYKLRYIFEGLSHLVSTILINNVVNLKRITDNGVKRMCKNIFSIQQQLTGITLNREVALDYCRQYYELFLNNKNPEDLLSTILEKGLTFASHEYVNAVHLMHRSLNRDQYSLDSTLKRLNDILKKSNV